MSSNLETTSGQILPAELLNFAVSVDTVTDTASISHLLVNSAVFFDLRVESSFSANLSFNTLTVNSEIQTNGVFRLYSFTPWQTTTSSFQTVFVDTNDQVLKSVNQDDSVAWLGNRFSEDLNVSFQVQSQYIDMSADLLEVRDANNNGYAIKVESIDISSQDEKGFLNGIGSSDLTSGDIGQYYYCYNFSSQLEAVFVDSNTNFGEFTIPDSYTHFRRITERYEED